MAGLASAVWIKTWVQPVDEFTEACPLEKAPFQLQKILKKYPLKVEVRRVPDCRHFSEKETGYYWRTKADPKVIQAHIDGYYLKKVGSTHPDIITMAKELPIAWRPIKVDELDWYRGGIGDDGHVGDWFILGVDKRNNKLYFFHLSYNYAA